ncbi:MAG: hypothetical protein ACTSPB_00405 [Candidatus Thorarchaeota archaeon]
MGELEKVVGVFKKYGIECGEDIFQVDRITTDALFILGEIFSVVEPLVVEGTMRSEKHDELVIKVTHCKYCNKNGLVDRDRGKHIDDCDPIKIVWVECPKCEGTKHFVEIGKDVCEKKDGEE